jgi:hypothetical protein
MKITTEAHGAFPQLTDLRADIPHIAFVNSSSDGLHLTGAASGDNILVLAADDLDVMAIPAWIRGLLVLPEHLSYRVKRYALKQSRINGQPSAPMAIGDARQILTFVQKHMDAGAGELLISCEYGKSRSVTAARFLNEVVFKRVAPSVEKVPNAWVYYLMGVSKNKTV